MHFRYILALTLFAFIALPMQAQEAALTVGETVNTPVETQSASGGISITQNASTDLLGGGVSCASTINEQSATTENFYLRAFVLADFITEPLQITDVDFGASYELYNPEVTPTVTTTLSLHRLVGQPDGFPDTFPLSAAPLVNDDSAVDIELAGAGLELLNGVFTEPVVVTPEDTLVVAWFVPNGIGETPDGEASAEANLRFGQNDAGQEGPTYLATDTSCGGIDPTAAGLLGESFAVLHWVVVVNGVTVTANESDVALPRQVTLGQSYPNPFNAVATIPFAVRESAEVTLTVYDALGREVSRQAAGTYTPGEYTVQFDGANLPNGVYTYRLQAGNDVQVRKMVLVK